MNLFDLIKKVFSNDKDWEKIKNVEKNRNYFMINRIMSIRFPIQADQFNKLKITPYPVVDWWHRTLTAHYKKTPSWVYTKTKKNTSKGDEKKLDFLDSTEDFIRERYSISKRDLRDLEKFYPDRYKEWISEINSQINTIEK